MNTPTRKKVLLFITKSNWGGAQRYVYDIATHLNPQQFDVAVVLGGDGELTALLRHAGIRVITLGSLQRDIALTHEWAVFRELSHILRTERPDVFHVNSSKAGGIGALLGRVHRVPHIIFTAHGWAFNEDRPWWQRIIIKGIHWLTVLLSHRTIAVSHAIVRDMSWPGAHAKMKVIHPGRTIGAMYGKREAREKICDFFPRLAPHQSAFWVGCIAELIPIKRHRRLLEAFEQLRADYPQARLVLIGDGPLRDSLAAYIEAHNLTDTIYMVGHVSEAARFLKAFDIFVLPSKSESYGYVVHEAGLAGVPVVASDVGGIPDIVRHRYSGVLVPPDNSSILRDTLSELMANPDLRHHYAEQLHVDLKDRTVEKMVRATAALYQH